MGPKNGINLTRVNYFSLAEYIDRITLRNDIFYHIEDTSKKFENYIKFLSAYDYDIIIKHLIDSFTTEIQYSNLVERHLIKPEDINKNNVFFDSLSMSHSRIKNLHKFVQEDEKNFNYEYRKEEARVSYFEENGEEHIFWYGAEPEDIKKFMDDYIDFYKSKGLQMIDIIPFIRASLCHLLFVRIHPFGDGNGRTARLIYDMKFTEMINKLYGTNLKISPLHLSMSIYLNQPTYVKKINDIYFDIEHNSNDEINKFFEFILNMTDEQIHYMMTDESKRKLDCLANETIEFNPDKKKKEANEMKLSKLLH